MTWAMVIALGAASLAGLLLLRVPRAGREAIGAAIMAGIAGYALQGSPYLAGAPKAPAQTTQADPERLVAGRKAMSGAAAISGNRHVTIADALARHGQFGDAAAVLLGAVERNPDDAESWLALGNALTGHADGMLSPAALFAYRRAMAAAPDHPGPPFFLGLALAGSGRYAEARETWARLLAASPPGAPWRADLAERLTRLDAFLAQNGSGPAGAAGTIR